MIAFTSDIDWAPEEVIEDTLALFQEHGVKCTLFATHASSIISSCNRSLFEIAIHPNFNSLLNGKEGSIDRILDAILEIYPGSKGVRSHSLMQSTLILSKFLERGLIYDSNYFLPYSKNSQPFKLWNGMIRIPFNWEDDIHCLYGFSFEDSQIDISQDSLNVFNFHPIHVYLNTETLSRYESAKPYLNNTKKLLEFRNDKKPGSRDLLIHLLHLIKVKKMKTKMLKQVVDEFLQKAH